MNENRKEATYSESNPKRKKREFIVKACKSFDEAEMEKLSKHLKLTPAERYKRGRELAYFVFSLKNVAINNERTMNLRVRKQSTD